MTIRLNRQTLSVLACAHPDATRYAMNGVHIDGAGLTATDGKCLAHVTHGEPVELAPDTTYASASIKALAKTLGRNGEATLQDGVATHGTSTHALAQLAGIFPPYSEVMPLGERTEVGIDLAVLERVVRAARAFFGPRRKGDGPNVMRLAFDADKPADCAITLKASDAATGRTFTGLVMPLLLD